MFSYSFLKDLAERAIRTAAQAAVAFLTTAGVLNGFTIDYWALAGISVGAALLSALTSVAATQFSVAGTASFSSEVTPSPDI